MKLISCVVFLGCLASVRPHWPYYHLYKVHPIPYHLEVVHPFPFGNPQDWKIESEHSGFVYVRTHHLEAAQNPGVPAPPKDEETEDKKVIPLKVPDIPKHYLEVPKEDQETDVKNRADEKEIERDPLVPPVKEEVWSKTVQVSKKEPKVVKKVPIVKQVGYYPSFGGLVKSHEIYDIDVSHPEPKITITKIQLKHDE